MPRKIKKSAALAAPYTKEENPVQMFESPESSQVRGATYNKLTHVLTVVFVNKADTNTGTLYEYQGIPEGVWEGFRVAPSKGKFVNTVLVGNRNNPNYRGVKVA